MAIDLDNKYIKVRKACDSSEWHGMGCKSFKELLGVNKMMTASHEDLKAMDG